MHTVTISPFVIIRCYQLAHMIPPPPATTLMLPGINLIDVSGGCYLAQAPPATFWYVKCMEVAEVQELMNDTNQWPQTSINLVKFASQTQIRRKKSAITELKPHGSCLETRGLWELLLSLDFYICRWRYILWVAPDYLYRRHEGPWGYTTQKKRAE